MAEPSSSSSGLLYLFVVVLGPVFGPYAFVLFGATLGGATALSKATTTGRFGEALFLGRVIGIALLFTMPAAHFLSRTFAALPFDLAMPCVAYAIGWKWDVLIEKAWPWILERMGIRKASQKPEEDQKEAGHE
jgi:hypothetical protein